MPQPYSSKRLWTKMSLQWRHNERDHQPLDCLLNRLFRRISKKTSKLRVTGRRPSKIWMVLWCFVTPVTTLVCVFGCKLLNFQYHIDGLVQDCGIPIANALEILQSDTNTSISYTKYSHVYFCMYIYSTYVGTVIYFITVINFKDMSVPPNEKHISLKYFAEKYHLQSSSTNLSPSIKMVKIKAMHSVWGPDK